MSATEQRSIAPWDRRAGLADVDWRKMMMWAFIITDGLMFAALLASYGYARLSRADWPDPSEVFSIPFIAAMTFVLISSSASMAAAVDQAARGSTSGAIRWLALTMLGGVAFLGMQAWEWSHLIHAGARLGSNPWGADLFGAYFFLVTGFHGTHVLSGVIVIACTMLNLARDRSTAGGVEIAGLYWHFVDLVWVAVFTFFYLF